MLEDEVRKKENGDRTKRVTGCKYVGIGGRGGEEKG